MGMIHPRMSEPHTTGQCQGIAVAGLRSEGLVAIPGVINTRCRAQSSLRAAAHEAVMAVDRQLCHAPLARSLTGQSLPIGLVKEQCFPCVARRWTRGGRLAVLVLPQQRWP